MEFRNVLPEKILILFLLSTVAIGTMDWNKATVPFKKKTLIYRVNCLQFDLQWTLYLGKNHTGSSGFNRITDISSYVVCI